MWLSVVPYLTEAAVSSTLSIVAALPGGAEVVFDFGDPPETQTAERQQVRAEHAVRVAGLGEPWISTFEPAIPSRGAAAVVPIEDLGPRRSRDGISRPRRRGVPNVEDTGSTQRRAEGIARASAGPATLLRSPPRLASMGDREAAPAVAGRAPP